MLAIVAFTIGRLHAWLGRSSQIAIYSMQIMSSHCIKLCHQTTSRTAAGQLPSGISERASQCILSMRMHLHVLVLGWKTPCLLELQDGKSPPSSLQGNDCPAWEHMSRWPGTDGPSAARRRPQR